MNHVGAAASLALSGAEGAVQPSVASRASYSAL
jgi:hypothetical protein